MFLGRGEGAFEPTQVLTVGAEARSLVAVDLDGDGRLDLATANRWSDDVSVLLGTGNGLFLPEQRFPVVKGEPGSAC